MHGRIQAERIGPNGWRVVRTETPLNFPQQLTEALRRFRHETGHMKASVKAKATRKGYELVVGSVDSTDPKDVSLVVLSHPDDFARAVRDAISGAPPTVERIALAHFEGLLGAQYLHGSVGPTRHYIGQPSSTAIGSPAPVGRPIMGNWSWDYQFWPTELDPSRIIYPRPLAPTKFKRRVETIRARNARFLREAVAEVEDVAPSSV